MRGPFLQPPDVAVPYYGQHLLLDLIRLIDIHGFALLGFIIGLPGLLLGGLFAESVLLQSGYSQITQPELLAADHVVDHAQYLQQKVQRQGDDSVQ